MLFCPVWVSQIVFFRSTGFGVVIREQVSMNTKFQIREGIALRAFAKCNVKHRVCHVFIDDTKKHTLWISMNHDKYSRFNHDSGYLPDTHLPLECGYENMFVKKP